MRIRTVRAIATTSFLAAGLAVWPGCNAENPDGTKTNLGKMEDKAAILEKKAEAGLEKVGHEIKVDAAKAVDATGKGVEKLGEKLETSGKDAVEKNLGEKAGAVVEGTGKALDKAGEKIQDSVKKP